MNDKDLDKVFSQMFEAMRPALGRAYTHAKEVGIGWMRVTVNEDTGMVEVENPHPSEVWAWSDVNIDNKEAS